jgi:hypothetical protein
MSAKIGKMRKTTILMRDNPATRLTDLILGDLL